jgi:hypothetical protein
MKYKLPKGTEKLNKQQFKNLSHGGLDEEAISDFHDHIYKKDGLLIYYLNLSTSPKLKKPLESYQKMMVALLSGKSELKGAVTIVDESKIITINNIRYSIIESHVGDNMTIQFTSDYDKSGGYINGFIEYKKPDEAKAKKYLQDFLGNTHFKDN